MRGEQWPTLQVGHAGKEGISTRTASSHDHHYHHTFHNHHTKLSALFDGFAPGANPHTRNYFLDGGS